MIKLLNKDLKIEDNNLKISAYYEKTTFVEISNIKFIYFRRNRFRYFYCALLVLLLEVIRVLTPKATFSLTRNSSLCFAKSSSIA